MTDGDAAPTTSGGTSSVEIELKFDVDDATPLPDWSGLPGVASVGEAEGRELDAVYFDTDDLSLAHAGYAVRRRTGGPDEGWHIKGPRGPEGGRVEQQWPLGEHADLPEQVRAAIAAVTVPTPSPGAAGASPGAPGRVGPATALAAIARIRNTRTAYALLDAAGRLVAEFVDDRVRALDERDGVERTWREWEFELGPAAPTSPASRAVLLAAAEAAVHAVGGRAAASASKLARALGR
ncbi:CYTH domain-containing protein [Microbacterium sp. CFH 90308]|uniref:CYTH domain-containing protein n=1 Tax=Microbacterium salsuginis TaxID=2722803 RepID=A0ABX1KGA2_9MICO|nr:CYTH domain-containing protein [Microbacterium sp. CFH 90308]